MCCADIIARKSDCSVSSPSKSSSLSDYLLLHQSVDPPKIITNSVHDDENSAKLRQPEVCQAQLTRQNNLNSATPVARKPDCTVSSPSKSPSLSDLRQSADQPHSIVDNETSARLHQLESSHFQLTQQLAATSASLRLRTLGFEAMIVLVKRLTDEVWYGKCRFV